MMNKDDQIELRSEKVRNIIGQIPPFIIRSGIVIIFIILLILCCMGYFLKYPYKVNAEYILYPYHKDLQGFAVIPANKTNKILPGQKVSLLLGSIPHLYGNTISAKVDSVDPVTIANKAGGYNKVKLRIIQNDKINLSDTIKGKAEIDVGNFSFWDRISSK